MKISYAWLQTYFTEKLPEPEKLSELLTMHLCEVENIEEVGSDKVLNLKILPDRACYALSHRGIASEVGAILGVEYQTLSNDEPKISKTKKLSVSVTAPDLCIRHIGRRVENISVKESPEWLKNRLLSLGQRSINNIVDATNFVTFDMGQPLHAFDADKIKGGILIRRAKTGEQITLLNGLALTLDADTLVIADEDGPLDIAGIKGGKKAELDSNTKNIILSAANFNAGNIRKTSQKTGVKTDASKRFESGMTPDLALKGMREVTELISKLAGPCSVGESLDVYPKPEKQRHISVSVEFVDSLLGVKISEKEIIKILESLNIKIEKEVGGVLKLLIPSERLDLVLPEDITEEVGRLYGYEKIPATLPPVPKGKTEVNKTFYYENKIREILINEGFSEIMTSSFAMIGDIEIANPLAEDKAFLRKDLRRNFEVAFKKNLINMPLFGSDALKQFEIGAVSTKERIEGLSLALGCVSVYGKKMDSEKYLRGILETIKSNLNIKSDAGLDEKFANNILEFSLNAVVEKLPAPEILDLKSIKSKESPFQPISAYPFILRDIAIFVPENVLSGEVLEIIKKQGGELLFKETLFDEFKKGDKISYAFRLVFQSNEKTLSDAEINKIMENLTLTINAKSGWQVR